MAEDARSGTSLPVAYKRLYVKCARLRPQKRLVWPCRSRR